MKWIDLPPVWLLGCLAIAWAWRWPGGWDGVFWLGFLLLAVATALFLAAAREFARVRTTIIPHETPSALIATGIFRFTRNPIYLADLLILAGFAVIWGSVPGLVLLPVLGWILTERFIRGEEARMRSVFGTEFETYSKSARRWL